MCKLHSPNVDHNSFTARMMLTNYGAAEGYSPSASYGSSAKYSGSKSGAYKMNAPSFNFTPLIQLSNYNSGIKYK